MQPLPLTMKAYGIQSITAPFLSSSRGKLARDLSVHASAPAKAKDLPAQDFALDRYTIAVLV